MLPGLSRTRRLLLVLAANLALVAGLLVVGITARSVAVFAEGADYLADAAAVGLAIVAVRLGRRPATARRPQGYPRATRVAAAVNAGALLAVCAAVAVASADRLLRGAPRVQGGPVLVVSAVAAVVMLGCAALLGGEVDEVAEAVTAAAAQPAGAGGGTERADGEALALRAVLLDTAGDAAAAAGVAASGAVIAVTHRYGWLDPLVALVIAVVLGGHAAVLLRQVARSLAATGSAAGR